VITRKNLLLVACGVLIGALAVAVAQQKQAATTQRTPQFENPNVKVWKTLIMPNQPLTLHRHENGRVIVALQGGTLTIKKEKGDSKKVVWETGKAYWLDADPPGELHGDVNETTKPIEVMVVELQKKQ
jgi:beta-alanine degradation protein BauB